MKLATREDIGAPIDTVYDAVSDFDAFERRMLRRGIDITRDPSVPLSEVGATWKARVTWRGRSFDIDAKLAEVLPGQGYSIESISNGIVGLGQVELVALSKARTRMFVSLDLSPTSLSSRVLLQSLRLAKGNLSQRFKTRIREFASSLSE